MKYIRSKSIGKRRPSLYRNGLKHNWVDNVCTECGCVKAPMELRGYSYRYMHSDGFLQTNYSTPPCHPELNPNKL